LSEGTLFTVLSIVTRLLVGCFKWDCSEEPKS